MLELLSPLARRCLLLVLLPLPGCSQFSPYQQRRLVEWAASEGGRVVYDHQARNLKDVDCWYTTGSEEDEQQWQSRLPEDTWSAKTFGPDYAYRVESVSFYESRPKGDVSRLGGSKGLKDLHFVDCELSEELFAAIGKCGDLEQLYLSDCQLENEACLAHLAKLSKLKQLSIISMSLPGNCLAHIGRCRGLELLELSCSDFDAKQVQHLQGLTKLRHCALGLTSVGDEELGVLRHWPNLTGLAQVKEFQVDFTIF